MNKINLASSQSGFGLIEALVSLLVISIGLLGVAALQITSLSQAASAQWHSQAAWYTYDMADRIHANRRAMMEYDSIDTNDAPTDADCMANTCTPAQMADADAADWAELVQNLPSGRGVIDATGNALMVTVMWADNSGESNCINGEPDADGMSCFSITLE